MGEVPAKRQDLYREAMEDVVAYYADRYGLPAPEFGLYIGADIEAVRAIYAELTGLNPEAFVQGGRVTQAMGGTNVMFIYGSFVNTGTVRDLLLAHEYFHILQRDLSGGNYKGTPLWLVEGSAVYESMLYSGLWELYRPAAVLHGANHDGALRDLEDPDRSGDRYDYPLGALASEWLAEQAGRDSQAMYWRLLERSATWDDAFVSALVATVDEFYEAFEEHFGESLSELPTGRVEGIVLGSGGEALRGIRVQIQGTDFYERWSVETGQDGTFELHALDGMLRISIYARDASGTLRHVGWYGDGGFATDRGDATVIELDGADATGIQIRLPANPAELAALEPPRVRGTALRADGEPNEGIGVWVWGGSLDNSKLGRTSADGTFDIPHQNGTFVIRVHFWRDAVWHLAGYYGEGGFTFDEEEATEIEIDGADLTGIEIRLPSRVRGIVLGADGEPAEGVAVWVYGGLGDNTGFAGISSDGTFDIYHENGRFFIRVYVLDAGAWRHVGWYGGESGFTADGPLITQIEIDGADVTGIDILLPADPADLPTVE